MASQTPNAPAGRPAKKEGAEQPKRGIKNPIIYAGTVVLLVVTIIAFVFVPSVGSFSSGGAVSFGSYAGKNINYAPGNYLARQVQAINENLRQQGLSESNFQLFAYQVWRSAFEQTVLREGVLDTVKSSGVHVTEARLDERMAEMPQFQEDGKFSPRRYRETPSSEKMSLRDELRIELLSEYFFSDAYGLGPSSAEIEFVKNMAKDTRTLDYVAFPLSLYPDSELAAWAEKNPSPFRRLKLSRITLDKEDEAAKVRAEIEGGADFAETAKKSSKDSWASQGGDLGLRYFHELASELDKAEDAEKVASLQAGGLSPVLKTMTGSFIFYRVETAAAAADFSDPSVLASVRAYMESKERGTMETWILAKAKNFSGAAAQDFAGTAKRNGLEAKTTSPFSLNYGDLAISVYGQTMPVFTSLDAAEHPALASASRNEKFLTAAFSLAPGAVSEPIILGDNIVVLRVKEAGTALDEETSMISFYYPFLFQQKANTEIKDLFLKSPKLKDNFMNAYLKFFSPKES